MKRFILIGHVDHGKSTLAGHLLYKMNKYSEHEKIQAEKDAINNKMIGWKWAYLLDQGVERVKGKTHEFTIESFEYNNNKYELIDTPGHKTFIRSMIEAVGMYKNLICVSIVSVIENEFISGFINGQIKEQIIISRASGINNIIVCLNKIDIINEHSKIDEIKNKINIFLSKLSFKSINFIEISAYRGDNINKIIETIDTLEYNGKEIDNLENSQLVTKNKFKCEAKFFDFNGILTIGSQLIMHIASLTLEIEITKIKNKKIIKSGNKVEFKFQSNDIIQCYIGQNIIFRQIISNIDSTIGFGKLN